MRARPRGSSDGTIGVRSTRALANPKSSSERVMNAVADIEWPAKTVGMARTPRSVSKDSKADKTGGRRDEIAAQKATSVRVLLLAPMRNATLARITVHLDKLAIRDLMREVETDVAPRAPMHPIQTLRAMAILRATVVGLLGEPTAPNLHWNSLAANLRNLGHDPNWRRRPSVLDRSQGLTAPPAPSRKRKSETLAIKP